MKDVIKPHSRLLTKQWMILSTISLLILIAGGIIQFLVTLNPRVTIYAASRIIWPIAFSVIALLWIIAGPLLWLWVRNLAYYVDDERITIHKGFLTKVQQNIPYRAITDFMLHRSLYDRWLGIASLRVQTAGQSNMQATHGYEGNMAGLTDWEPLVETLRAKVKALHGGGIVSAGKDVPAETIPLNLMVEKILHELRAIRKTLEK